MVVAHHFRLQIIIISWLQINVYGGFSCERSVWKAELLSDCRTEPTFFDNCVYVIQPLKNVDFYKLVISYKWPITVSILFYFILFYLFLFSCVRMVNWSY